MAQPTPESRADAPPTPSAIFLAFASASLSGFGGVLPFARRLIVEERRWMSAEEFNEAYSLCQVLPGPNMVNFSIIFGHRCRGAAGAVSALAGILGPPILIVMAVGALYGKLGEAAAVQRVLGGLAAAAAGLILAASAKMAQPLFRRAAGPAPFVAIAVFGLIGLLRLPLISVLLLAMPVSIALAWLWRR